MNQIIRAGFAAFSLLCALGLGLLFAQSSPEVPHMKGNASVTSKAVISVSLADRAKADKTATPAPAESQPSVKPPEPEPKPEPEPEPKTKPKPEPKPTPKPEPKPKPEPTPKPEPKAQPTPPETKTAAAATAPKTSAEPAKTIGPASGTPSNIKLTAGQSDAMDNYLSRLHRHLSEHFKYPRRAKRRNIEGTPVVEFELDRNGKLISSNLSGSSDERLLDEAALAFIKESEPMPPVPDSMKGDRFSYTIPIRYELK